MVKKPTKCDSINNPDTVQMHGMGMYDTFFSYLFVFFFSACTMSQEHDEKASASGLFERMDDMQAGGGTDERVVEILMRFFNQLLGFPLAHPCGQEERLECRKHDVIAHPRKLPDAERIGVWHALSTPSSDIAHTRTFGPMANRNVAHFRDDIFECARLGDEVAELGRDVDVDALVAETLAVGLPEGEPAPHARRLAGAG